MCFLCKSTYDPLYEGRDTHLLHHSHASPRRECGPWAENSFPHLLSSAALQHNASGPFKYDTVILGFRSVSAIYKVVLFELVLKERIPH